jgi:hypothetical protein
MIALMQVFLPIVIAAYSDIVYAIIVPCVACATVTVHILQDSLHILKDSACPMPHGAPVGMLQRGTGVGALFRQGQERIPLIVQEHLYL